MQINLISIGGTGGLGDMAKATVAMVNAIRDEAAEGVRYMAEYPPKKSSSNYIRTGTLRNSWSPGSVKSGGGKIECEIGSNSNIAPYNRDVQGENQEELFKNIGWHNVDGLQSKVQGEFQSRIQRAIDSAFS